MSDPRTAHVTVHVPNPSARRKIPKKSIQALAERVLKEEGAGDVEVEIVLADDPTIRDLNRTYRSSDRPTDVLAFSMREGEGAQLTPSLLGEVYISLDRAQDQAQEYGVSFDEEVARLVIHGLLHLLGYNHSTMRSREEALLSRWRGTP